MLKGCFLAVRGWLLTVGNSTWN
uniref:Uncharacterized protein n=1 Tax=Anguilla anguilla TaxID=7936 RepID=A0A0E9UNK8_ANGAN